MCYARRNFQVPVPRCASWEELNRHLRERCLERRAKRIRGEKESAGERFVRDQEMLLALPPAPLQGWQLPEKFGALRRQMEARMSKRGRREYVQELRLLETFWLAEVTAAVRQALELRAISFDAVKHRLAVVTCQRADRAHAQTLALQLFDIVHVIPP